MAYLYSSSKTWRRIVDVTSRSAPTMLAFAAACVAVPWFLGDQVGLCWDRLGSWDRTYACTEERLPVL